MFRTKSKVNDSQNEGERRCIRRTKAKDDTHHGKKSTTANRIPEQMRRTETNEVGRSGNGNGASVYEASVYELEASVYELEASVYEAIWKSTRLNIALSTRGLHCKSVQNVDRGQIAPACEKCWRMMVYILEKAPAPTTSSFEEN